MGNLYSLVLLGVLHYYFKYACDCIICAGHIVLCIKYTVTCIHCSHPYKHAYLAAA